MRKSIEVEIAEWLFDWAVFGLLQALGKFTREDIFLRFLCFHGRSKLGFHGIGVVAERRAVSSRSIEGGGFGGGTCGA